MNKIIISIVIGVVGSVTIATAAIASSSAFDSTPIENIEKNINILRDKVIAYSINEEKLVKKYKKLYEEYTKLKEATEQNTEFISEAEYESVSEDLDRQKEKNSALTDQLNELEQKIENLESDKVLQEKESKEQADYIKELEQQIERLESNKVDQEKTSQTSDELEVE